MSLVAGIDVGASTVRAAIADEEGTLSGRASAALPHSGGADATEAVVETLRRAIGDAAASPGAIDGTAIGSMGPLDVDAGAVVDPPNVPGVDHVPLVDPVAAVVDSPVELYNDAVAGVIGVQYEADRPPENLVYVTISSGIGIGAIVDGRVLRGATGNAGELGHVVLEPDSGRRCGCGRTGHWEALCSGANLGETVRQVAADADVATELDLDAVDAPALFDAAGSDPLADHVLEQVGRWNARGIATVVHAYDPSVVHIGGGVSINNPQRVLDPIQKHLPDLVVGDPPTVTVAPTGRDTVLRGAVAAALS